MNYYIRTQFNRELVSDGDTEKPDLEKLPGKTKPNMAESMETKLNKYLQGIPLLGIPTYNQNPLLPDTSMMDKVDKAAVVKEYTEALKTYDDGVKRKEDKAKRDEVTTLQQRIQELEEQAKKAAQQLPEVE